MSEGPTTAMAARINPATNLIEVTAVCSAQPGHFYVLVADRTLTVEQWNDYLCHFPLARKQRQNATKHVLWLIDFLSGKTL